MQSNSAFDGTNAVNSDLSRRDFVAMSVAAGLAGGSGVAAAALPVVATEVTIKMPEGNCDAAFFHPATGSYPGVLVWPDAFGLRASMRDIGRRLAGEGYAVLVPNVYYRAGKAPMWETAANVDFQDPAFRAKLGPLRGPLEAVGAAEKDAAAYVAFLDAQEQVNKARPIGTQGYCMGGALVMRTAAALPKRVGAGASFHGGGLVTDTNDSPHYLVEKMKARMLIAIAQNDDQKEPETKDDLKEAFSDIKLPVTIEVYPANHGWCVPDMPQEGGVPIYNQVQAERAWSALLSLYKASLG